MAAPSHSDYELLTEHFSYPPVSLLDDIINTVNVLADRALDSVERLLLSIPPQKLGFNSKKSKSKSQSQSQSKNPEPEPEPESNLPPEEAAKLEIENGTHQLETLLNASIDKTFDVFELYVMQNILNVKVQDQPYMRLSHYAGLDLSAAQQSSQHSAEQQQQQQQQQQHQEDKPTTESITALRRRLQASQKINAALEAEKARNEVLLRSLRSLLGALQQQQQQQQQPPTTGNGKSGELVESKGPPSTANSGGQGAPFAFLRDKGGLEDGGGDQPITTTTEFTLSQLKAVRTLSRSLRALLPDLADAAPGTDAGGGANGIKSWRRERVEYIETSSRKYLETVGGLELSPNGDARDGDWQGQGRGLSKGEVEGLEKIVALIDETRGDDGTPPSSTKANGLGGR